MKLLSDMVYGLRVLLLVVALYGPIQGTRIVAAWARAQARRRKR